MVEKLKEIIIYTEKRETVMFRKLINNQYYSNKLSQTRKN